MGLEKMINGIRFVPEFVAHDGFTNMAMHEFILSKPTLVFSTFSEPGVLTLSKNDSFEFLKNSQTDDFQTVRRQSGGKPLYHDPADFTYAISVPKHVSKRTVYACLEKSFKYLGIKGVESNHSNSLLKDDLKKIAGSAVYGPNDGENMLIHGSIFFNPNFSKMSEVYGIPESELREKVTFIKEHSDVSLEQVYQAFKRGFLEFISYESIPLTDDEWAYISDLAASKYSTKEWNEETGSKISNEVCQNTWTKDEIDKLPEKSRENDIYAQTKSL